MHCWIFVVKKMVTRWKQTFLTHQSRTWIRCYYVITGTVNCVGELDDTWIHRLTFQLFFRQNNSKFIQLFKSHIKIVHRLFATSSLSISLRIRKGNGEKKMLDNCRHFPVKTRNNWLWFVTNQVLQLLISARFTIVFDHFLNDEFDNEWTTFWSFSIKMVKTGSK